MYVCMHMTKLVGMKKKDRITERVGSKWRSNFQGRKVLEVKAAS